MSANPQSVLDQLKIDLKPSNARLIAPPESVQEALYPGAHIATGVEGAGNMYHHGIVLDTNGQMEILHFWGPGDKTTAKIQTTTLAAFLAGSPELVGSVSRSLYLISYANDNAEKRQRTVDRARELLKSTTPTDYNLLHSNCECVAFYCRTGSWVSKQVITVVNELVSRLIPRGISGSFGSLSGTLRNAS
ncbi:unnamed protein product [Adineta ricciae]|uniref:LRAT domain-containing protein n=1 Tax=Adineta ricciae TaxID=249248 RepID=A0A816HL11_ADIRI|nr:unnamed protein product [Adineta ricciae]